MLQESGENYLENILILTQKNGYVRSVDLARAMDFSKPSVSRAVHLLEDNGYLKIHKSGNLELTERGAEIAQMIYERHIFITDYLMALGVSEDTAARDACRMEHVLSEESFEKMKRHISYCAHGCPHAEADTHYIDFNRDLIRQAEEYENFVTGAVKVPDLYTPKPEEPPDLSDVDPDGELDYLPERFRIAKAAKRKEKKLKEKQKNMTPTKIPASFRAKNYDSFAPGINTQGNEGNSNVNQVSSLNSGVRGAQPAHTTGVPPVMPWCGLCVVPSAMQQAQNNMNAAVNQAGNYVQGPQHYKTMENPQLQQVPAVNNQAAYMQGNPAYAPMRQVQSPAYQPQRQGVASRANAGLNRKIRNVKAQRRKKSDASPKFKKAYLKKAYKTETGNKPKE